MRAWIAGLLGALLVLSLLPAAAAAPSEGETDLGAPVAGGVLSPDQAQGVGQEGEPQAYWVTNGNEEVPAQFAVTDVRSGETVFEQRIPSGTVSWAVEFSEAEGAVYFGMTTGELYRWRTGDEAVESLGEPLEGEQIWRLGVAPDGTVFGGTYPSGRVFAYDPETGDVDDYGQVNEGETYARSIVADEDAVWVGSQPNAKLSRLDPETGESEDVPLPEEYQGQSEVYDMTRAADLLFVRVQPANDLLVYRPSTGEWVDIVESISARAISPLDPSGQYVYFRMGTGEVVEYDVKELTYTSLPWGPNAFPGTWAWVDLDDPDFPGLTLALTYYYGRIYTWNMEAGAGGYLQADLEPTPVPLQALSSGPDGNIYAGAFLSPPGMARFDPDTGETELLGGTGQVEGFGTHGDSLLFGRYPNADVYAYDTTEPWAIGTNPSAPLRLGEEQDRPQAFASVDDRVAVGSVPKSGRLGGALTMWDPETGAHDVYRDLIAEQSIVSLAAHDGLVYGGSSVYGGYGIDPEAEEAELFVFDPEAGEIVDSFAPIPGHESTAVSALTFGPDGDLYGIAGKWLFRFDPDNRRVTRRQALFPESTTRYGTERELAFVGDQLYATTANRLWEIDPDSWEAEPLAEDGVKHLAVDRNGDLYFTRGTRLFQYKLSD